LQQSTIGFVCSHIKGTIVIYNFFQKIGKRKSWAWNYTKRKGGRAYCNLCDDNQNKYSCVSGTTGSIIRYLQNVHQMKLLKESGAKK
jgi:hypothetical protein